MALRSDIRDVIAAIPPGDAREAQDRAQGLAWIDSGAPLFRVQKPATPPRHLVSYFVLIDGDHVLLVDHLNAGLWLPTGGHVNPDEHPADTVRREAAEELGLYDFIVPPSPTFLTITETVGRTRGHTDVSLWYPLCVPRQTALTYDTSEFSSVAWVTRQTLPWDRCDPNLGRFLDKMGL
ncbi:DNA mismatch repair protein MutT [Jannaschia pagri]|uniref:DNA mismatch repair protein MutT n=1 Tax=Jannaschia pagri TaxID=2829797 RepID=A0ABQ4NPR7_9RHOB|nr:MULTISPECIES: NUDIX domain-containing protein [unclassified Jannaschia]GIT92737.1 DNA mismatch repair protein MutT [Jannaschia sp. AI_61]GIT96403.1 DNA mismatch repair protein MutT [Jannaschia sp. AI_62]